MSCKLPSITSHVSEQAWRRSESWVVGNDNSAQVIDVLVKSGECSGEWEGSGEGEGEDVILEGEVEGVVTANIEGKSATSCPENAFVAGFSAYLIQSE
ncbi:hypothetical protein Tco_1029969 [Tanacetum coccineum]|uniref:Uncharacterized protein n=1 Tax=Tanacetum coccineum TaxID=301880 RepID=A0ABQ5G645_9ASTR